MCLGVEQLSEAFPNLPHSDGREKSMWLSREAMVRSVNYDGACETTWVG